MRELLQTCWLALKTTCQLNIPNRSYTCFVVAISPFPSKRFQTARILRKGVAFVKSELGDGEHKMSRQPWRGLRISPVVFNRNYYSEAQGQHMAEQYACAYIFREKILPSDAISCRIRDKLGCRCKRREYGWQDKFRLFNSAKGCDCFAIHFMR